jgi:hypothetical protein
MQQPTWQSLCKFYKIWSYIRYRRHSALYKMYIYTVLKHISTWILKHTTCVMCVLKFIQIQCHRESWGFMYYRSHEICLLRPLGTSWRFIETAKTSKTDLCQRDCWIVQKQTRCFLIVGMLFSPVRWVTPCTTSKLVLTTRRKERRSTYFLFSFTSGGQVSGGSNIHYFSRDTLRRCRCPLFVCPPTVNFPCTLSVKRFLDEGNIIS